MFDYTSEILPQPLYVPNNSPSKNFPFREPIKLSESGCEKPPLPSSNATSVEYKLFVKFCKEYRKEIYKTVTGEILGEILKNDGKTSIIVHAPVKSGKRSFVELCMSITKIPPDEDLKNDMGLDPDFNLDMCKYEKQFFITSLVRKADEEQLKEISNFNIDTNALSSLKGSTTSKTTKINSSVFTLLNKLYDKNSEKSIIDYLKECEQQLPNSYVRVRRNKKKSNDTDSDTEGNMDVVSESKTYKQLREYADKMNNLKSEQMDYNHHSPIVHIDESDYGTNSDGLMAIIWRFLSGEHFKGSVVLYSATPYETIAGIGNTITPNDMENFKKHLVTFTPPHGYCGAEMFIKHKLLVKAEPFFEFTNNQLRFSEQGNAIIRGAKECVAKCSKRNIIMLRISTKGKIRPELKEKDNKTVCTEMGKIYGINGQNVDICFYYDEDGAKKDIFSEKKKEFPESFKRIMWGKRENEKHDEKNIKTDDDEWKTIDEAFPVDNGKVYILIIDQVCARSTELKFHDRIFAYHDYRDFESCAVSTITQAQERVAHYSQAYGGYFQPIYIFGDVEAMEISASENDYNETMKVLSHRVKKIKGRTSTNSKTSRSSGFIEYTTRDYDVIIDNWEITNKESLKEVKPIAPSEYEEFIKTKVEQGELGNVFNKKTIRKIKTTKTVIGHFDKKVGMYCAKLDKAGKNFTLVNDNELTLEDKTLKTLKTPMYGRPYVYEYVEKRKLGVTTDSSVRVTPCYKDGRFGVDILWPHNDDIYINEDAKKIYNTIDISINDNSINENSTDDNLTIDVTKHSMYKLFFT